MGILKDAQKVTDLIRHKGLIQTGKIALHTALWPYHPRHRRFAEELKRQRVIDEAWDQAHNVQTTTEQPLVELGVPSDQAVLGNGIYRGVWVELFAEGMKALPSDLSTFTFIDFGSGKGRAMLMASDYPFRAITGVEFAPGLHAIALENIKNFRSSEQKCRQIAAHLGDATTHELPPGPLVCFFFNPFQTNLLTQVFARIASAAAASSRPVYVVYTNPRDVNEHQSAFAALSSFRRVKTSRQCLVMSSGV